MPFLPLVNVLILIFGNVILRKFGHSKLKIILRKRIDFISYHSLSPLLFCGMLNCVKYGILEELSFWLFFKKPLLQKKDM